MKDAHHASKKRGFGFFEYVCVHVSFHVTCITKFQPKIAISLLYSIISSFSRLSLREYWARNIL